MRDAFIYCVFCCAWINYVFVPSHQELVRALLEAALDGRTEEVIVLLDQGAGIAATDKVRHVLYCSNQE